MASRNKAKADATIQELSDDTGRQAIYLELDLASLSSVRRAAEEFLRLCLLRHPVQTHRSLVVNYMF